MVNSVGYRSADGDITLVAPHSFSVKSASR